MCIAYTWEQAMMKRSLELYRERDLFEAWSKYLRYTFIEETAEANGCSKNKWNLNLMTTLARNFLSKRMIATSWYFSRQQKYLSLIIQLLKVTRKRPCIRWKIIWWTLLLWAFSTRIRPFVWWHQSTTFCSWILTKGMNLTLTKKRRLEIFKTLFPMIHIFMSLQTNCMECLVIISLELKLAIQKENTNG